MVWSDWEQTIPITEKFITNAKADEIKKAVQEILPDSKLSLRVLGLSGLGKTRMLLEVFRPINGDDSSIMLSSRVIYIKCNYKPNVDFQVIFSKLNLEQEGRIVSLDNCSIEIHRQALGFAKRGNNKTSFISLDSNPEEINQNKINGVNYLVINKEDLSSVVDEILNRDFGGIGAENIKTIKEFSQGIPLMAVLLAESVKNGEKFIGKLEDKLLLDKLLGPKGQEHRNRTILKACSIFNYFGFSGELTSQVEFIAKNKHISSLNGDDIVIVNEFNEVCDHYLKRGIFERRGRFIGMRPFPLAMSLAQEWLEPCTPARLVEVIVSIAKLPEPDRRNLSEALSERMKYLGYNDKALEIVDRIIGPGSPFDNAEVLNTELGSRLFRSFVEVNPIAVSQNFKRQFFNKSTIFKLFGKFSGEKRVSFPRISPWAKCVSASMAPVKKPTPSGLQGTKPIPSSSQSGIISFSGPRHARPCARCAAAWLADAHPVWGRCELTGSCLSPRFVYTDKCTSNMHAIATPLKTKLLPR